MSYGKAVYVLIVLTMSQVLAAEESQEWCLFSSYPVGSDGQVAEQPLVAPGEVSGLEEIEDPASGETVWEVAVSDEAAERVYSYSKKNVGGVLANFCGENEISRPVIQAPFRGRFRLSGVSPSS